MSNLNKKENDRREYFRFDDNLTLNVRILGAEEFKLITDDFDTFRLRYCMKSHMQNQSDIRKPQLMRIRSRDSDAAAYIESLEQKIAQLAERMDVMSNSNNLGVEVSGLVNISATGIRFNISIPLKAGDVVEMHMVLSTLNTQVVVLGEVQRAEEKPECGHCVIVKYTHIHTEDIEAIVRHLAKLQQIQLQATRLGDN